ncbi:MAG: ABC transporter substrate-binding protein [Actinomycetota bacterium]
MKKTPAVLACIVAVSALTLVGCSAASPSSSSSASSTPFKIGLMIPISTALSNPSIYEDPANDAVKAINKDGGIDGRKIVLTPYDTTFTTAGAITAVQKALSDGVNAMIGMPIADQVLAVRPLLDKAKVPLLFNGGGYAAAYTGGTTGASVWSFRVGPPSELTAAGAARYAIKTLKEKNIGIVLRGDQSQQTNTDAITKEVKADNGKIVATRSVPVGATDVTTQILAMKDADAVISTDYQPGIVQVVQGLAQQGIKATTLAGQTGYQVFLQKLLTSTQYSNFYSVAPCNPSDARNATAVKWVTAFEKAHNFVPDANSSTTYDAFFLIKQATEKAKSQTPAAILKSYETLNDPNGICSPYKTDSQHFMGSTEVVIGFGTGTGQTLATYDFSKK